MKLRRWFFLLASLACYWLLAQNGILVFLLLATLIVVADKTRRYWLTVLTIFLLAFGFVYFKVLSSAAMLFGYSVFAFTGISFLVDQHKNRQPYGWLDTMVYLFFFPKMLAGPIVRAADFIPQFSTNRCSGTSVYQGFKLLIYALFIKFMLADTMFSAVHNSNGIALLLQSFVWGIRFYLDFYAYSLMAVGGAMLFGIALPYNFDNPYAARSFKEFWQRWNITLSAWLRDYIYIPLGGNRCSRGRTIINVIVTFVVSGLWHGVAIPFVLWGLAHAVLVCLERFVINAWTGRWLQRSLVVLVSILLWQLFRFADCSDIVHYFQNICSEGTPTVSLLWTVVGGVASLWIIESQGLKRLVFEMASSRRAIVCEASFFAVLITVLVLCPMSYSFNFFYFNY